ncbi:hypothetical protein [Lewinella sp. LCG006]|uniref:hypothetical protein n=1 Tax=Lewinella sp. LCG006 TaxID=3231911 RepID=UPI003460EA95
MTFNEIIESLKKANVSSPGKALQLLPTYLKSSATNERDTLDLLQARMKRHVDAEIEGTVSRKELNIEYQELLKSVQALSTNFLKKK